jgi:hypothetical protein
MNFLNKKTVPIIVKIDTYIELSKLKGKLLMEGEHEATFDDVIKKLLINTIKK